MSNLTDCMVDTLFHSLQGNEVIGYLTDRTGEEVATGILSLSEGAWFIGGYPINSMVVGITLLRGDSHPRIILRNPVNQRKG